MRFFKKTKKNDGWLSFALLGDGIAAASVRRAPAGRPLVEISHFALGGNGADALEKLGRELNANQLRCLITLAGGEYQMLTVDAPNVPADELRTAVRWRLKDMLDVPVDEATVDVLDIPVDTSAAVRANHSVFALAARNSVIKPRQELFTAAKIELDAIDIPEMAQRNISAMIEPEGRGVAMLSFGGDGALLTVTFKGELYLSRRIDVPLADVLDPDFDRKHASFDKVTLEVQRSLDHFDRQFHFISVASLVLAPSGASGLEEYLSSNLYTPVSTMDLADVFDLGQAPQLAGAAEQQRFFLSLGAALRLDDSAPGQQINLFNPLFRKQKQVWSTKVLGRALAAVLVGALLVAWYASQNVATLQREAELGRQTLAQREVRLAKAKAEFAPRSKSAALAFDITEAETRLQALRDAAAVLERGELGNTIGFAGYFKALARQQVAGVWLTGVSIGAGGTDLAVQGRALDPALVPAYLGRLTKEQVMRGKAFNSLKIGPPAASSEPGAAATAAAAAPFVEFKLESTLAEAAK